MHIAIEGMDGSGKTSQAKKLAERIGGIFIAKSFHEMTDTSGTYDNFVTIEQYTNGVIPGVYGLRQNYLINKLEGKNIVTDRFYVSNYWSRADSLTKEYYKKISYEWGEPDIMIILYADSMTLYKRIFDRNPNDKDLSKPQMSEQAYELMFALLKKMNFDVLLINNTSLTFDETSDIIFGAYNNGIEYCLMAHPEVCKIISNCKHTIKTEDSTYVCVEGELVGCDNYSIDIRVPEEIKSIRERAFEHCKGDITISIPKSVEWISSFAFINANVVSVDVAPENENYASFNGMLFDKQLERLVYVPNKINDIVLPPIKEIGNCAMLYCTMNRIDIPDTVERIGYASLLFCNELKEIVFKGRRLRFLAPGCFYGCDKLYNIVLDGDHYIAREGYVYDEYGNLFYAFGPLNSSKLNLGYVEYIYPYAFARRLDTRQLSVNAKNIGSYAFLECNIRTLELGGNVQKMGEMCFADAIEERVVVDNETVILDCWSSSIEDGMNIIVPNENVSNRYISITWKRKRIWCVCREKDPSLLCGNACIDYISGPLGMDIYTKDLIWVVDIVSHIAKNMRKDTTVYYWNSNLMSDYHNGVLNEITEQVGDCIKKYGDFCEKKITEDDIRTICNEFEHVILCVRSESLFRDKELKSNNHYVILESVEDSVATVISPGKDCYYKVRIPVDDLCVMMEGNGQWVICCGHK